jgi:hypothetical protein
MDAQVLPPLAASASKDLVPRRRGSLALVGTCRKRKPHGAEAFEQFLHHPQRAQPTLQGGHVPRCRVPQSWTRACTRRKAKEQIWGLSSPRDHWHVDPPSVIFSPVATAGGKVKRVATDLLMKASEMLLGEKLVVCCCGTGFRDPKSHTTAIQLLRLLCTWTYPASVTPSIGVLELPSRPR